MKSKPSPVKFLLVDDREENLLALEALLRRDGLEILKARSGDEALELLLVHDVALALLDVQMPEMDGFALAELMRGAERSRHVPIIFVTAATEEQHRVFRGYDAGAVDFLFKPIDARILRHKVDTFFQLYKQRQELAETLRLNEMFVAAVGHDLKNPLQTIVMAADLILASEVDGKARKNAERLRSSTRKMVRLIDDLFDLARARLGNGIPLEPALVDAAEIVGRAVAECELTNPDRPLHVSVTGECAGRWDPVRFEQVVFNLVGNAIRHGTPGTPIEVQLRGEPALVRLSIQNAGAIAPDALPHLFDPFRARQGRRALGDGLGLGLYIVNQIVLSHGGQVEAESTESEGTTFRVELPKAGPPPSE
jgi:two-component system sensor histidine kinase/response regulator